MGPDVYPYKLRECPVTSELLVICRRLEFVYLVALRSRDDALVAAGDGKAI